MGEEERKSDEGAAAYRSQKMSCTQNFISSSEEETHEIGRAIAKMLQSGDAVCFSGDLGAGKTTLIKGIAAELAQISPHAVNSPTFTYLNIYEGATSVYHFDCYRLENESAFLEKGFDDYFGELCLIEWPERISGLLPIKRIQITIESLSETKRKICYEKNPL